MGQFIDDDLTLDTTSELAVQVQPEKTINHRTPYFDLDSVYGYRANLAGDNGGPFFGFIFDPAEFGKYDGDDLTGGSSAPRRFIGWQTFFDFGDGELKPNKKIDTHVSTPLFNLLPIAIPGGPSVLVQRTLLRHLTWQIPSDQQIARTMGVPILSAIDLQELAQFDNSLLESTPLFYYVLKEAERLESGEHLGPVGGRIVGDVFVNNLRNDPNSYLNADPDWTPSAGGGTSFRMTNFLTYARVAPTSRGQ